MAKFIIGVIVGIFLGASGSVHGAVAVGAGTVQGWTVNQNSTAATAFTHSN